LGKVTLGVWALLVALRTARVVVAVPELSAYHLMCLTAVQELHQPFPERLLLMAVAAAVVPNLHRGLVEWVVAAQVEQVILRELRHKPTRAVVAVAAETIATDHSQAAQAAPVLSLSVTQTSTQL
jgi:hypothetical protein